MGVGAQELADVDVPGLGVGVVPGEGEGVAAVLRLQDHVVAGVGAADDRRVRPVRGRQELGSLALGPRVGLLSGVRCPARVGCCVRLGDREGVKIQPDNFDVVDRFCQMLLSTINVVILTSLGRCRPRTCTP